jgi:hypothetical protein
MVAIWPPWLKFAKCISLLVCQDLFWVTSVIHRLDTSKQILLSHIAPISLIMEGILEGLVLIRKRLLPMGDYMSVGPPPVQAHNRSEGAGSPIGGPAPRSWPEGFSAPETKSLDRQVPPLCHVMDVPDKISQKCFKAPQEDPPIPHRPEKFQPQKSLLQGDTARLRLSLKKRVSIFLDIFRPCCVGHLTG